MNVQSVQYAQQRNQKMGFGSITGVSKKQIPADLYGYLANRAERFIVSVDTKGNISIKGTGHPITLKPEEARNGNAAIQHIRHRLDGKR